MSKTFKLIIVLVIATYHFSFIFCNYYSEPKIISYRQRKSGTWPRSFKINQPRKAFQIIDRKGFEITDIYSEKFLKEIESRMSPKPPVVQKGEAAVEQRPRKKGKFPETGQKSKLKKNVDMVRSEKLPPNVLEEPTEKIKNSQKEVQQLKEEIRKEKHNKKDRQKRKKSLSIEIQSEQDLYPTSRQTSVEVEKNILRGGQQQSGSISRQHCVKKCYTPKCEVECIGRQGSAACSADKCRASARGPDSAAVCKGEKCKGLCFKAECVAACEGPACAVKCVGNICHAVAEGRQAESTCEGDYCVSYGKGPATKPKCYGRLCQTWCVGDSCTAKCVGFNCEAMCNGRHCKAQCVGKNCTQFHYAGDPPKPDKPWFVDTDSKPEEIISISDESDVEKSLETKLSKYKDNTEDDDDDDGYYGNKNLVKNTINGGSGVENVNYGDNSGNLLFLPVPVQVPLSNTGTGDVTLDYSVAFQLSKRIGGYLKKKITELKDLSLLRYLPSLLL